MNVVIVIGKFPPGVVGGAELQAEAWARRLADRHRVTVVTRRDPAWQPDREERDGFSVLRLPVSRVPGWRSLADVAAVGRVVNSISPRPDVLLCFMTFLSGLAGVWASRGRIPVVVWIRGEGEYRLAASRLHRAVSPWVWTHADAVVVQSERNRGEMLRELERVSPRAAAAVRDRLEVVPNGLELPAGPLPPGDRVLSVGRLIADKGMDVLVEACALAGLPLTIAGDGPERPALEALARARGADVRFEGFVSRERLDPLYRSASACVLASRRGEGLPNVVLEAMSYARPVIVTPSGATRDLVTDGESGLVVPAGDAQALAGALRRVHGDAALRDRLGAKARELTAAFSWDAARPRLEAVLQRWAGG